MDKKQGAEILGEKFLGYLQVIVDKGDFPTRDMLSQGHNLTALIRLL